MNHNRMAHQDIDDGFRERHAEILAEREQAVKNIGSMAAYLTAVELLAQEEFNTTGHISDETRDARNSAGQNNIAAIGWLLEVNRRLFAAEQ